MCSLSTVRRAHHPQGLVGPSDSLWKQLCSLQTDRQQGWSHSSEVPAHSHPRLCCLGPVCCRFVSYIKKPVRLNTLRELVCAPEQSLLLSLSDWRRAPMVPRAGTGDVDSSTSNPRNINCFLWHLFVTTIGNEKFSRLRLYFVIQPE